MELVRLLIFAVLLEFAALARGSGSILHFSAYPDASNNFAEASFACALPTARPEGILFLAGGTDSDSRPWLRDARWKSFAEKHRLVLMAASLRGAGQAYEMASGGSGQALLAAVKDFARQSGQRELSNLPLILYGHSAGAQLAFNFACWRPDRVRAIVCVKSGPLPEPPRAALPFAALFIVGEHDQAGRMREVARAFAAGRSRGARWTLALQPEAGHGAEGCRELSELFIGEVIASRSSRSLGFQPMIQPTRRADLEPGLKENSPDLPSEGSPDFALSGEIDPESSWLPGPDFARAWRAFTKPVPLHELIDRPNEPPELRISWQGRPPLPERTKAASPPVAFTYAASLPGEDIALMELGDSPPALSAQTARGPDGSWLVTGKLDPRHLPSGPCKHQLSLQFRTASGKHLTAELPLFTRVTGPVTVSPHLTSKPILTS